MSLVSTPLLAIGQSFVSEIMSPIGQAVMAYEHARVGRVPVMIDHGPGGSSLLWDNAPASNPDYFYVDDRGGVFQPGPQLVTALSKIAAAPVKPVRGIINLNHGDALGAPPFDAAMAARWQAAFAYLCATVRAACGNSSMGIIIDPIGSRIVSGPIPDMQAVREVQLAAIAAGTVAFGWDTYHLRRLGDDPVIAADALNSHHGSVAIAEMVRLLCQRLIMSYPGDSSLARMPPWVSGMTRAGDTLTMTIGRTSPIVTPDHLSHWAMRVGNTTSPIDPAAFAWNGDDLEVADVPAGARLLYPYGEMDDVDRSGIIFDANGGPLQSLSLIAP